MTGNPDIPLGRAQALERLRSGLSSLADLGERLDGAQDDRERGSVLLFMITAAWQVHEQATDAYSAVTRARDDEGLARGVLE
jgi:hypothetical protein